MSDTERFITINESEMDLARRACQLTGVRIYVRSAERPYFRIKFSGRHSDEAASIFLQMMLRYDDYRP